MDTNLETTGYRAYLIKDITKELVIRYNYSISTNAVRETIAKRLVEGKDYIKKTVWIIYQSGFEKLMDYYKWRQK